MVNKDQAVLIFQMILAQHADKTWGDIYKMFGVKANELDRDIKLSDSFCKCFDLDMVFIDCENSVNYLLNYDAYNGKIICFGKFGNGEKYKEIEVKKLLSIISFEDKV